MSTKPLPLSHTTSRPRKGKENPMAFMGPGHTEAEGLVWAYAPEGRNLGPRNSAHHNPYHLETGR